MAFGFNKNPALKHTGQTVKEHKHSGCLKHQRKTAKQLQPIATHNSCRHYKSLLLPVNHACGNKHARWLSFQNSSCGFGCFWSFERNKSAACREWTLIWEDVHVSVFIACLWSSVQLLIGIQLPSSCSTLPSVSPSLTTESLLHTDTVTTATQSQPANKMSHVWLLWAAAPQWWISIMWGWRKNVCNFKDVILNPFWSYFNDSNVPVISTTNWEVTEKIYSNTVLKNGFEVLEYFHFT